MREHRIFRSTQGSSGNKYVSNILRLKGFESCANVPGFWTPLMVRATVFSEDQGVFEGHVAVLTITFDVLFSGRVEAVDSNTVLFFGDDAE